MTESITQQKVPASPLAVLQLFRVVFRAAQQYSADTEKALGISGAQAWLLAELYEHGPQKAGDLAARMAIKPATLSNMLIKLVELGYLVRQRSDKDQRVVEVSLTEQGRSLLGKNGLCPSWLDARGTGKAAAGAAGRPGGRLGRDVGCHECAVGGW